MYMQKQQLATAFGVILFFFICLFLYTKLAGPIPFFVNSVQTNKNSLFSVQGISSQTAIPNTALISIGVTKQAATVLDAQNQTNTASNKIIADLKSLGVEEKNIKTTNYSVNPNYDYSNSKQAITGYTVTQNLEVKVSPIEKANRAVDTATANGGNLVGGIQFVLDDDTKKQLEKKAREEAVKNAKEKAQSLANAAGISLGRIVDIQEYLPQQVIYNQPLTALRSDTKESEPTSLQPGENEIKATITLSYETH